MKKLIVVLLLSSMMPLCAMGDGVITGVMGDTPSPVRRPQGLEMSKNSRGGSRSDDEGSSGRASFPFEGDSRSHSDDEKSLMNAAKTVFLRVTKALDTEALDSVTPDGEEEKKDGERAVSPASEDEADIIEGLDSPVSSRGGGGGGGVSRVSAENAPVITKWYNPKSPVLRIAAPTSFAAIIIGGYLTRRHVKVQRALGKPTIFDRMWSKSKQWKKRAENLIRREKKQA